jgi:hypothetical protein
MDKRQDGSTSDIYAQKLNSTGHPQWTLNGTAICNIAGLDAEFPRIDCDSSGNLFIAWEDSRNPSSDIYAQKLNSTGAPEYSANGTVICNDGNPQINPVICADGLGGAIIAWPDLRSSDWKMYAQKINYLGVKTLTPNGILLASEGTAGGPRICSDGAAGAIIVWNGERTDYDIIGQRLDSAGVLQWSASGLVICGFSANQLYPEICSDGAGGAIVTWEDARAGSTKDVYAQKVKPDGTLAWTSTGEPVCVATDDQIFPAITGDGSGNAIITWRDKRTTTEYDIYAQRVTDPRNDGIPGFASLYLSLGLLTVIALYHRKKYI